jgi:hypothetical protein
MELPRMSDLRADLVPHHEWAIRRWFYANPIWYYHRRSAQHEICAGGRFYQLVDPELRELCQVLNDAGIRTTPSCAGHSYPRSRFEQIWQELSREAPLIRTTGLVVKDSENDRPYLFHQSDYELPWPGFDAFYREAGAHQDIGYLGLILPPRAHGLTPDLADSLRDDPRIEIRREAILDAPLKGDVVSIIVNTADPQPRRMAWGRVTDEARQLLARHGDWQGARLPSCHSEPSAARLS